jgi:hypothetical protein
MATTAADESVAENPQRQNIVVRVNNCGDIGVFDFCRDFMAEARREQSL